MGTQAQRTEIGSGFLTTFLNRFVTPIFLHAGLIHFLFNMLAQVTAAGQVRFDFLMVVSSNASYPLIADRKGNGFRGIHYYLHGRWDLWVCRHFLDSNRWMS